VIELGAGTIEDRFRLGEGEGACQLFVGSLTKGMMGGGFLYTNRESLSLGIVVGVHSSIERSLAKRSTDSWMSLKNDPR